MNLSIVYFVFIFFLQLLLTDSTELINQCPTSRRLLLFGNLKLPFGEKKSSRQHSSRSITYIQPQTSQELGKKVQSFTHLLKPKLFTNEEKLQLKRSHKIQKKKVTKKKDSIEHTKTKDLIVPINKHEIDRCRSLLQIDEKKSKKSKRDVPISSKVKNATNQLRKSVKKKVENAPTTPSKVKPTKKNVKEPIKSSTESLKYKPSKPETITIIEQIHPLFDEQNNSAVNRAFYFVKNMFQLSEQSSDENQLPDEQILDLNNEQQTTHHRSRKLLSFDGYHLPKRRLLTTKSKSTSTKTNKKSKDAPKPKVGWEYRYRISRYLEAQKAKQKRTGREKKSNQSITKRKLLQYDSEEKIDSNEISDQNIINTVTIMSSFIPKRQLLASKSSSKNDIDVEKKKKNKHIDPIAIVPSHEQNSEKPHVGWEFRYRVSKYMDSLRENIREDQQRLKSDLQTMKQKRKAEKSSVPQTVEKEKQITPQQDADLDPELAQINEEGRKVGWAYRYRIRRKLDHLKLIQAETGVPFDLATLSGKREKKVNVTKSKQIPKKKNQTIQEKPVENKKAVGWEYRYRVRRKLDAMQQPPTINQNGKRTKKSKKKSRENTNDLSISTFFYTLISTAKKSVCFLPISTSFCPPDSNESIVPKKSKRVKKLRTKKEHRAKQFIRGHHTKLGAEDKATERRVDEQMKRLYRRPSYPPLQVPPAPPPEILAHTSKSDEHVERVIGVDSKKNQNKKKNQIIGQPVKIKPKHSSPSNKQTTTEPVTAQVPLATTASVPLRTLSELIKEEAATILKSDRKESQTPEEIQYEINETKEIIREQKLLKASPIEGNNQSTSSNDTANLT